MINDLKTIILDNKLNKGANTSLYEYIGNNYNTMSKEELKEIILNLDYAIYSKLDKEQYLEIENVALKETIERN